MLVVALEKSVFGVAALAVLAVGGLVGVQALVPIKDGIPPVAIESDDAANAWLEKLRDRKNPKRLRITEWIPPSARAKPQRGVAPPKAETPTEKEQAKKEDQKYFAGDAAIPKSERVPFAPWLRAVKGVDVYKKPKTVSRLLYRKYQSLKNTMALVQEGGGKFVETSAGTAYEIKWVDPNSLLATKLGLREGDRVISVNGRPIGKSLNAGKAMFDELKNEKRFAVLIERKGKKMVVPFMVR